ncbi:MAG TPA: SDR family NAD(P)-dependent oxidoreductase, partial [Acidimicrobiia bacterium]|nr:SDR family NAD(P)-dependent oxidoreductase [Acidimicrobiia bacterium]
MDITGASAVVTGGASGIGAASARALAARGARCALIDLNEELGEKVAAEIGGVFVKANVADAKEVQAAIDAAGEMGPL